MFWYLVSGAILVGLLILNRCMLARQDRQWREAVKSPSSNSEPEENPDNYDINDTTGVPSVGPD